VVSARRVAFLIALLSTAAILVACISDRRVLTESVTDAGGSDASDGSTDASDGGTDDGGCIDPNGFGGRGCWRCPATTQVDLLRACTTAHFEVFDNAARIENPDASDPGAIGDGGPNSKEFDATPGTSGDPPQLDVACPLGDATVSPNPVMVYGATGLPMETIASAMWPEATIYFIAKSSCDGVGAALQISKMTGYVTYYDQFGGAHSCRMAAKFGDDPMQNADIALSTLSASSCSQTTLSDGTTLPDGVSLPNDWRDWGGPINPAMFAVPPTSTQRVISAEAAYRVYGFGSGTSSLAKTVTPWIDENFIFRRNETSGTQQTIARTIGLPDNALRGTDTTSAIAMREALSTVPDDKVQSTIGISTAEIVDTDRSKMRSLAYQHYGQPVGFYPDSEPGLFDRRNVRDGHYLLWQSFHVLSSTDNNGDAAAALNEGLQTKTNKSKSDRDKAVKKLVDVMSNRAAPPRPRVDLFAALKDLGGVPQCAMKVKRAKDGDDIAPFAPDTPCGCAFEAVSPGATQCKPCSTTADCGGTNVSCNFGYCE
jgi:hypothetical protein